MIATLSITILSEGVLAVAYARWRKKPAARVLMVSVLANILTQSMLWTLFLLLPAYYLVMLFAAEAGIWLLEAVIYAVFPGLSLTGREAVWLSLGLNLASFAAGWFLSV